MKRQSVNIKRTSKKLTKLVQKIGVVMFTERYILCVASYIFGRKIQWDKSIFQKKIFADIYVILYVILIHWFTGKNLFSIPTQMTNVLKSVLSKQISQTANFPLQKHRKGEGNNKKYKKTIKDKRKCTNSWKFSLW